MATHIVRNSPNQIQQIFVRTPRYLACPDTALCYFVMWRTERFVKIGTTYDIKQRMMFYKGAYLFGVTEGYFQREAQLHDRFSHLWVAPERFKLCDELIEWMLYNTHQDVPSDVWRSVHRFPRVIFNDLVGHDEAQYRMLGEGKGHEDVGNRN